MLRQWMMVFAFVMAFLGTGSKAGAQETLRLAWAGFSPTNSPIWVIEDRKLLQKMGVQPEIISISSFRALRAIGLKSPSHSKALTSLIARATFLGVA
jgi:hypothetical protein